ncbi:hypothetical protein Tco_0374061 [Tanacetum coccineum]
MPSFPSPEPKVSYFDDLDFFKDFENEFPAIVYNDALTSKPDFLTEPTLKPQPIDEFDLKDETSLFEHDEEEQNVLYFNDLFPFNVIYPDDSKSDKDNDEDKIDIKQSLGGNVINIDDGAYAHGSNKLLEISHDKSNKRFKAETFITELNVNIMIWNHLNKGMSLIFLIKNLHVPFGIPFDPKLFYKDGINLGQDADGAQGCSGIGHRMSWRQFILALGLHTAEEMETVGFGLYWAESGRLITCSIVGRSQAPEKVTMSNLFYLRGMDVGSVNVPYLLSKYLSLFASRRKHGAMISGGQFVAHLAEHFGLFTKERLHGLTVIVRDLPVIDMAELLRLQIYEELNDMIVRLEEEVHELRQSNVGLRGDVDRSITNHSGFATWMVSCMTQLMDASGRTYQAFDSTLVGSSWLPYQRRTRRRTGDANTSTT